MPDPTTVAEVMLRRPLVLPATASLATVASVLADDHVHLVLLTEGRRLVGTVARDDLPEQASRAEPALPWARLDGRTVGPEASAEEVRLDLLRSGRRRFAVVDERGDLLGLVCLKQRRTGFCSDDEVAARAAARAARSGPHAVAQG